MAITITSHAYAIFLIPILLQKETSCFDCYFHALPSLMPASAHMQSSLSYRIEPLEAQRWPVHCPVGYTIPYAYIFSAEHLLFMPYHTHRLYACMHKLVLQAISSSVCPLSGCACALTEDNKVASSRAIFLGSNICTSKSKSNRL